MLIRKILLLILLYPLVSNGQNQLVDQSYLLGREYYVLRSGRAEMVIQSDKVDVGPAFTYLLYDAHETSQSSRKSKAYNYSPENGIYSTALEVKMKNFAFTALGHTTNTKWVIEGGIPSVEAVWWASGIKVREVITPTSLNGIFKRSITLESADLVNEDTVSIRLSLHAPARLAKNNVLIWNNQKVSIALIIEGNYPLTISSSNETFEIGPMLIKPGEKKTINSYLIVAIPSLDPTELYAKSALIENTIQSDSIATADKWKNSNTINTSDKLVKNMYDACRFILPGFVADNGKMNAGVFEYGSQWVRDASNTVLGMIHIGEFEIARAMLNHMLKDMITDNGTTMIGGGFDEPGSEQFDQMGEFMHAIKSYVDWTRDTSLLTENKSKITSMIERPLEPVFRDSTGMVHNTREFWERTFEDAYELAYQTWVIVGLRDAADLSKYLGAEQKAAYWQKEADKIQKSMLTHPTMKLVDHGHLIKRRNVTGEIVDTVKYMGWVPGAPAQVESHSRLMPDATMSLPISLQIVNPKSELSKNTLKELEHLWNSRWSFGGYDRYNTSSQGDQPGPWTFATTFILRAQHEAGELNLSRRSLEWLYNNGGHTGAWFEEIPIIKSEECCSGLLPWTTAEVSFFMIHHLLGIKFIGDRMVIRPALYKTTSPVKANLRYRKGRIDLEIKGTNKVLYATINGIKVKPDSNGAIWVPRDFKSGTIIIINKDN